MRLLVLFAAWAGDAGENATSWLGWYRDILFSRFANDDKFVAVNHGSHEGVEEMFGDLPGIIGIERVAPHMHVDSDAAGFQLALARCRKRLGDYDYVLFLHAKGVSHPFAEYEGWRPEMESATFDRDTVAALTQSPRPLLVCHRGHMTQAGASLVECAAVAEAVGNDAAVFNFAATTTIFYAHAAMLHAFIDRLPATYLTDNLRSIGHNRFFFEGVVPSQLVMLGAEPIFLGGAEFDPKLNGSVSFAHAAAHNSALVLAEFARWREQGHAYRQVPVPYVFCAPAILEKVEVAFSI